MATLSDSLKREIGQHFVLGILGDEISDNARTLIRDYYVGNIIVMKRNVKNIYQVRKLTSDLQSTAKEAGHERPLMLGTDQENGLVAAFSTPAPDGGTHFPGAMAQAATGDPQISERIGAATAKELKLAGLNWVYSPVADVNSDSRNPVIGVRSFGDDPSEALKYASAAAKGLTREGAAPSTKHFPGHGDTNVDSHLGLPIINKSLDDLRRVELVPFTKLIQEDDIASVMTGHMALPLITASSESSSVLTSPAESRDTPASMSRRITNDLLRRDLGFKGVIVTDCLEMDAIAKRPGGVKRGAVEAIRAGADIVMICHTFKRQVGAIEAVWKAVESGELSMTELEASGVRVKALKERFAGSWEEAIRPGLSVDGSEFLTMKEEHRLVSEHAYAHSITLIRDPSGIIPLSRHLTAPADASSAMKVVLVVPEMEVLNRAVDDAENIIRTKDGKVRNTAGPSYAALASSVFFHINELNSTPSPGASLFSSSPKISFHQILATRTAIEASSNDSPLPEEDLETLKDASVVIFGTRNADQSTWQLEYLARLLATFPSSSHPTICVLATCGPYDLLDEAAAAKSLRHHPLAKDIAYLASFEFTTHALEAATRVMFGKAQASGRCPVKA